VYQIVKIKSLWTLFHKLVKPFWCTQTLTQGIRTSLCCVSLQTNVDQYVLFASSA